MKIGLVGYPGSGKTAVFGALTGLEVETGYSGGKSLVGTVKVPDERPPTPRSPSATWAGVGARASTARR
jgi:ribosome-binding ATPase YchF (GTP1/OBG family)